MVNGWTVTESFPVLLTTDLGRALGFYRDLLGGTVAYAFPAEGDPVFVSLDLGSSHLGLGADPEATAEAPQRFSLWVYVSDCDAAVERLRSAGIRVVREPRDEPWGERVARVLDPDGTVVDLGQAATAGPAAP